MFWNVNVKDSPFPSMSHYIVAFVMRLGIDTIISEWFESRQLQSPKCVST